MVRIECEYEGELHCKAVHGPSGLELSTDAPKDNQGRGESFSPTDLVATALGTCMLTIMGLTARRLGVAIEGSTVSVEKEMSKTAPRRIAALTATIHVPGAIAPEVQEKLERAALACPVHQSLHPEIRIAVEFRWAGAAPELAGA